MLTKKVLIHFCKAHGGAPVKKGNTVSLFFFLLIFVRLEGKHTAQEMTPTASIGTRRCLERLSRRFRDEIGSHPSTPPRRKIVSQAQRNTKHTNAAGATHGTRHYRNQGQQKSERGQPRKRKEEGRSKQKRFLTALTVF